MYFQIYDKTTGRTLMTCPSAEEAQKMLDLMRPVDPGLGIRPIMKSEHPLARKQR